MVLGRREGGEMRGEGGSKINEEEVVVRGQRGHRYCT